MPWSLPERGRKHYASSSQFLLKQGGLSGKTLASGVFLLGFWGLVFVKLSCYCH